MVRYADAFAINSICADLAVHQSPIVPDLKTWTTDRSYEVQVFIPSHLTQHNVSDRKSRVIHWHNGAKLAGLESFPSWTIRVDWKLTVSPAWSLVM